MKKPRVTFYFDYVDPASYLVETILEGLGIDDDTVPRFPFELRPPPVDPLHPDDPAWSRHGAEMAERARALDVPMRMPRVVPWTRKAHELGLLAREKGRFQELHRAIFAAYFRHGEDIGRIDVLVEVATRVGLERTETRVVLDVDRFAEAAHRACLEVRSLEIPGIPTLAGRMRHLSGLRSPDEIEQFVSAG